MKLPKSTDLALNQRAGHLVLGLLLRIERVHLLWWVVLAIWLVAALLLVRWMPTMHAQRIAVEAQAALLQQQLANQMGQPLSALAPSAQDSLQSFQANLGDPRDVEQQLKTLFVIARDLDIRLPQGQYKLECEAEIDFCRYTITLPVEGSYVRIRTFVEQTLRAIHFASVDEVSFRRESAGDAEVQSRMVISLYTRRPRSAASADPNARPDL